MNGPAKKVAIMVVISAITGASLLTGASGQRPFVDGQRKPRGSEIVPSVSPRSVNSPELFGADNRVITPPLDIPRLMEEDAQTAWGPVRIGVVQEFQEPAEGMWSQTRDHGWLWTLAVEAPGAKAIRMRLTNWDPPTGAQLIVYDPDHPENALGPITGSFPWSSDTLWTPFVYGSTAHVEYYLPRELGPTPSKAFDADAILNRYRFGLSELDDRELDCHLDVSCFPFWQQEADGVGGISSIDDPYSFFCSGVMYNRIPGDFTPLFGTARHCEITEWNANTVLVEWFYQSTSCDGSPPPINTLPQTPGLALLFNDSSADYTLVGLSTENTEGVTYVGWDAGYWDGPSFAYGIHHPGGSYKRITIGVKTGDVEDCEDTDFPLAWLIENAQGDGEVEPGSSGSPIFDPEKRSRGVLSCGTWDCNRDDIAEYGRLDEAYDLVGRYLDPTDPIYVDVDYTGSEHGTESQPFDTILEGIFAVIAGSDLHIESGTYEENLRIDKSMTLHARSGVVTIGQ